SSTDFLSLSKQVQSFSSTLSTRGSSFFIGSRGHWRGCFSGLLRQLVLLPGSDATPRLCPNSEPSLAELSIPQVLKSSTLQQDQHGLVYPYGGQQQPLFQEPQPSTELLNNLMAVGRKDLLCCSVHEHKEMSHPLLYQNVVERVAGIVPDDHHLTHHLLLPHSPQWH
ncbi:hypothetical protein XENORESO_017335, partial [Xenotaenia resolanae]